VTSVASVDCPSMRMISSVDTGWDLAENPGDICRFISRGSDQAYGTCPAPNVVWCVVAGW
jgi:hypothetical protein